MDIQNDRKCLKCDRPAYKSEYGESEYCARHGGNMVDIAGKKRARLNFYKTKWQSKIEQKLVPSDLKNLNEELGVLRMLLEERLDACKDEFDLITESDAISRMVLNINSLVNSIHNMDLKQAITAEQIHTIIEVITITLSTYITDKELLQKINDTIRNKIVDIL